ncbi:unnamed protein product, partial [Nippostrongylus brasiliensis]|uniref:DUF1758 domain-containing protein n=1 Tax=Nippostrongylus brasiliensis TaxID=27835 RepID=A0A0N4YR20_NIPBR
MPSVATSKSNLTKASKALIAAQALEVLSQRRKEFIDVSKALASDESPDVYLQQSGVDDIVIQAETIMATVASHLEEVNGLIDSLTAVESTETSPSVPAQEDQPQTTGITASSPDYSPAAPNVELITKDVITLAHRPEKLSDSDIQFVRSHGFELPQCQELVTPDILIGIDYFWDILGSEAPICLPSGMGFGSFAFNTSEQHTNITCSTLKTCQIEPQVHQKQLKLGFSPHYSVV